MDVQKKGGSILINKAVIIPTGNEILSGIVVDTNSPAIMQIILENYPKCEITRLTPVMDKEREILKVIDKHVNNSNELVIIIGGSGGGHRYVDTLAEDYTHSALSRYLEDFSAREIYGKNGHLWSKIVCGKKGSTIVINVPGPYVEAIAATKTLISCIKENITDKNVLCQNVAETVLSNYPLGGNIRCVEK